MRKKTSNQRPPIAIVGISALMPGSQSAEGFWSDILNGRDLITEVPRTHWLLDDYHDADASVPDKTYASRGAFLSEVDFDPMAFGVPPTALPAIDTAQLLALIVAQRVLDDAAKGQFDYQDREHISVILSMAGATELFAHMAGRLGKPVWANALRESGFKDDQVDEICERIASHYGTWQENTFPGLLGNVVAGRVANRLDLGGTNCVVDAACAGSLAALSMGINELYTGQSELSIVGGVDTLNDIIMYMCFSEVGALSKSGDCRPFSVDADGTMIGEGITMFAMKRLDDAERDGDRIYGVIRAVGSSSDGRAKSIYAPLPSGQAKALRRAYEIAGYGTDTVELIEAHGTGTTAGDVAEFEGLQSVFGADDNTPHQYCALGSVKGQIGHTKATAGSAGLFKVLLALHHKILPPTVKVTEPNPKLNIEQSAFYLNTEARPWIRNNEHPRRAGVSAFGFGGTNFHIALEEYTGPADHAWRCRTMPTELLVFSADQPNALVQWCEQTASNLIKGSLSYLAQQTQLDFDASKPAKLAIVAKDETDLQQKLKQCAEHIKAKSAQTLSSSKGVYYSNQKQAGKIAFLFPGQGSQYCNMGADVAMHFSPVRQVWDDIAAMQLADEQLHQKVFPRPVFSTEAKAKQEQALKSTEWAQPAIGAVSLGFTSLLNSLGVQADCAAGHSFGEVSALYAANVFNSDSFMKIARKRGELMAGACKVPGAMTAAMTSVEKIQPLLDQWKLDLVLANHNSPEQLVFSGKTEEIEKLEQHLKTEQIKTQRLSVSTAFHSPLVSGSCEPFKQFLKSHKFQKPAIPVFSNAEAAPYPTSTQAVRKRLGEQLANSVRFVEQIDAMYAEGVRTFIEVGPSTVLSNLTGRCLKGREHNAIALDQKGKNGITSLWSGLAQLVTSGVAVDFTSLWQEYEPIKNPHDEVKAKFSVKLTGTNYKKPYPPMEGELVTKGALKTLDLSAKPAPPVSAPTQNEKPAVVPPPAPPISKPVQQGVTQTMTTPQNQPATPAQVTPLTPPAPTQPMQMAAGAPAWLQAYQLVQQQTADAHRHYQHMMAESHLAFLRSAEASFNGLAQIATGAPVQAMTSAPVQLSAPQSVAAIPMQPAAAPMPVQPAPIPQAAPAPVAPAPVAPAPVQAAPAPVAPAPAPVAPAPVAAAPTPTPAAPTPAATPAAPASTGTDLKAALLDVVADKTGYPQDMLELSMALESDLGIDSIKRVEIFSALQEQVPELPETDTQQLASLHTLGEILDFYGADASPAAASPAAAESTASAGGDLKSALLAVVADKTGYPEDMLDLSMALESDLGIDSIKRVEIFSALQEQVPSLPEVETSQLAALGTLGEILNHYGDDAVAEKKNPA